MGSRLAGFFDIPASMALDGLHVDFIELLHEQFTVFRVDDSLYRSSEHLHAVFLQDSFLI